MSFVDVHPLLFNGFIILASLAILAKSADLVVYGISDYARRLGISDYLIGFIIVSIGTALPDLISAMTAAFLGQSGLIFGGIFGANLFAVLILGVVLLIGKKIKTKQKAIGNLPITTLLMCILPLLLVVDGFFSRVDGLVALAAFGVYIFRLWQGEQYLGHMKKSIAFKNIYKDMMIFCIALAAMLLSARFLVLSSVRAAHILSISPFVVGLLVIAVGGSIPELTVQIRSVLRKHQDIAFGNVLGSVVANSTFVVGLVGIISPFFISFKMVYLMFIFLAAGMIYILYVMRKNYVSWKHGIVLILVYLLFLAFEFGF